MNTSELPHLTHVPMPFATQGSTLLTVAAELSRSYAGIGGPSSMVLSHNRDLVVDAVPSVYVDYTVNCPREWFSRGELARDVALGALGRLRPYYGHLFDPAIKEVASAQSGGIVLLYEGHYASASLPRWRDVRRTAQVCLYVHNPVSRSYTRRELSRLLGAADRVIFCADHLRRDVEERLGTVHETFQTVHNGVDSLFLSRERRKARVKEDFTVLYFGRIAANKGVHITLAAAERAQATTSRRLQIRVVGSANYDGGDRLSDYERDLRRRAGTMSVPVDFVPFTSRGGVVAELASADVACLLSTWAEGFPLTALEAMAAGLPLVCSDSPGMREAAGRAASVVAMGDVEQSAAAISTLAEDDEAWTRGSDAGRDRAAMFTWERSVRSIVEGPTEHGL